MQLSALERCPQLLQFETHAMCNANCNFCCHSMMKRKKGRMPDKLIKKLLAQADGIDTLIPFLMGEPFLDNRIIKVLHMCRAIQPQCSIVLHSNMSLCHKQYATEIIEKNLVDEIHTSFYGISPHQYKKLQGLDYFQVVRNILYLIQEREKRGRKNPVVICDYILMDELLPYYNAFKEYWQPIVDAVRTVCYDDWHGDQPDRGSRFHPVRLTRTPCFRLWHDMNVHWDGNVVLCCIDYEQEVVLGNVNKQSLAEIWQGERMKEIRSLHMEGRYDEIPICGKCNAWKYSNPDWWNKMWTIGYYGVGNA